MSNKSKSHMIRMIVLLSKEIKQKSFEFMQPDKFQTIGHNIQIGKAIRSQSHTSNFA